MIALIDGDILAYSSACAVEKIPTKKELEAMGKTIADRDSLIEVGPVEDALKILEEKVRLILHETEADSYKIFISGPHDFRYKINPQYKANRKDVRRPQHLQACNEYLVTHWHAVVTDGIEADDALGIEQTKCNNYLDEYGNKGLNSIICTIDKDLDMIEGMHYRWAITRKGVELSPSKIYQVSRVEAFRQLYKQMLIGDTADNIIGVDGIGAVGASKLLDNLDTEEDMYNVVFEKYNDSERFEMNMKCLRILTSDLYNYETENNS